MDHMLNQFLIKAAKNGILQFIKDFILDGADVNFRSKNGVTPLIIASLNGHLDVVKELINLGAQVEAANNDGCTPLYIASQNGHLNIVEELMSQGANVKVANNTGTTPLHIASQNGHLEVVEKLINQGAQVGNAEKDGWTSLHNASQNGHLNVVEELISQGANVKVTNDNGTTPLHKTLQHGHKHVAKEGIIEDTANTITPLQIASQNVNKDVDKELITYGETSNNKIVLKSHSSQSKTKNKSLVLDPKIKYESILKFFKENYISSPDIDILIYELLQDRVTSERRLAIANINKSNNRNVEIIRDCLDKILSWNEPVNDILLCHIKHVVLYIRDIMYNTQHREQLPWEKVIFYFQQYIYYFENAVPFCLVYLKIIVAERLQQFIQFIKSVILNVDNKKLKEETYYQEGIKQINTTYDIIRDIYIFNRIDNYIKLWKNECNSEGHYWSTLRLLQVIGELLKSSRMSPNLSKQLEKRIKHYKIINDLTKFRNYLSHLTSIPKGNGRNVIIIIKNTENIVRILQQEKNTYLEVLIFMQNELLKSENNYKEPHLILQHFREKLEKIYKSKFATFEVDFATPLFKYVDLSPGGMISNYDDLLQTLKKSLESKNKLELEFVLCVVLNHLKKEKKTLNNNYAWYCAEYPTLTGAQLRNHLAHGDTIVQLLNIDEEMAVRFTAKLLIEYWTPIFTEKQTERPTTEEEEKFKKKEIDRLESKRRLFSLIKEGDLEKLKTYINTFDEIDKKLWINWCNCRQQNVLQQAAQIKRDHLEIYTFIFEQSFKNITNQINQDIDNFANTSLSMVFQNLLGIYPKE